MNVVITGASRGIGLELSRQALEKGHQVLAFARQATGNKELQALANQYKNQLKLADVDLQDSKAPEKILQAATPWGHVDCLFNNAGVLLDGEDSETFLKVFQINTVMPFLLTKTLLPLLQKSKNPKVIQTTSRMGSIEDNSSGGHYSYRSSKAALNMINKSLAVDHNWLTTIVMHPGWVQTEMGGEKAPVQAKDSAAGIWNVVDKITLKDTGKFYDFRSEILPW